ncbi:hypothetical protein EDD99_5452 [Streptomyces sp. 846.5]|nr:hypothetical protein [Streptomyces sp. 846.5]TDT97328.1 hypothetical protein EDD99_5452 [Streptomyces sp. 846.5]
MGAFGSSETASTTAQREPGALRHRVKVDAEMALRCSPHRQPARRPHRLPHDAGAHTLHQLPDALRTYLPYLRLLAAGLGVIAPMVTPSLLAAANEIDGQIHTAFEATDKVLDVVNVPSRPELDTFHRGTPGGAADLRRLAEYPPTSAPCAASRSSWTRSSAGVA